MVLQPDLVLGCLVRDSTRTSAQALGDRLHRTAIRLPRRTVSSLRLALGKIIKCARDWLALAAAARAHRPVD
jgi:hypothetical protein